MVDGAEHLISCHSLAFLSAFSHLQLIQNTSVGVNMTFENWTDTDFEKSSK